MSLVQQFLQQNLYKHLDHHLLQKLQEQQVAIEDMLYQISSMRTQPKQQALNKKIERVQNFIKLLSSVISILKDQSIFAGIQWIYGVIGQNRILQGLVKKDENNIKKQIRTIFKKIFLESSSDSNDHFQQNLICNSYYLSLKDLLKMHENKQLPQRSHLMKIDSLKAKYDEIVFRFQQRVQVFNFQMLKIVEKLYKFQDQIAKQFKVLFQQQSQQPPAEQVSQQQSVKENQPPVYEQDYNYDYNYARHPVLNFPQIYNHQLYENILANKPNGFHQRPVRMKGNMSNY